MYSSAPAMPAGDPTAVVGKRIGAAIIDLLITAAAGVLLFMVNHDTIDRDFIPISCSDVRDEGGTNLCFESGDTMYYAEGGKARAIYGFAFLVGLANHVLLQGATGASVGKHAVGLRVIKKDTGAQASFGPNALRWLVGLLDISCCFLIGLIMILTTKGHRRLGDMAAGTLVVGKQSVGIPPVVPGVTTPQYAGSPYATSYPPSSPMSPPMPASPGWPPPSTTEPPPPPSAPAPPRASDSPPLPPGASTTSNTPTWDPQRNTYVLFDATQNQWMQWDDAGQQWRPLT